MCLIYDLNEPIPPVMEWQQDWNEPLPPVEERQADWLSQIFLSCLLVATLMTLMALMLSLMEFIFHTIQSGIISMLNLMRVLTIIKLILKPMAIIIQVPMKYWLQWRI